MKASSFTIGVILMVMVGALWAIWFSTITGSYGVGDYNASQFDRMDKLKQLQNLTNESRAIAADLQDTSGGIDLVGITSQALQSIKIALTSFSVFVGMSDAALEAVPLGGAAPILRAYIALIVLVALVVGGFVAAVVKWGT